ncbi:MAG TPA: DUF134 domain-containing protein [Bacteroidota bacterium]|mgnify:CR=1 FL=1|nr:DUF134 domain-containing protein [Bacteroidota bacterium]
MPRPRIPRRILLPPRFLTFKPMGVPRRLLQRVTLSVDEFEAIRLADHERLDHLEAAARMGISRSTFSRLIDSAHGKVASCIIEGRELRIEGGEVDFEQSLQRCADCGDEVLHEAADAAEDATVDESCRICGSERVVDLSQAVLYGRRRGAQRRGAGRGRP